MPKIKQPVKGETKPLPKNAVKFEIVGSDDVHSSSDTVVPILLPLIVESPFEPQARRRARFILDDIDSLGNSIKIHGLAQPIVVRRVWRDSIERFEIVFGERRFLAAKRKGLKTINCFVRDLSDAEVLELQYEENHRRMTNEPLDDAFLFKFLMEKEGYSETQLADRLGTSQKNVTNKLKLNDLIEEAITALAGKVLPLKHAYYLSKFPPSTQKEIVTAGFAYKYGDKDEGAASYDEFKQEVEENILRRLQNAPFDPEDERLHLKNLKCSECKERTGFEPRLFDEVNKGDSCLNKTCFQYKTNVHLRLQRESIAEKTPNPEQKPIDEIVKNVPLVTERRWIDETPFTEKPLTNQTLLEKPECEHSVLSLAVDGAKKGQQVYVCGDKSKTCEIHFPKPPTPKKEELSEIDRKLLETNFDEKVRNQVHATVLKKAMGWFDDYKPFWTFDDLVKELINAHLGLIRWADFEDIVLDAVDGWKEVPQSFKDDELKNNVFVQALDKSRQSQILFLFTMLSRFHEPEEIRRIASDYAKLDYQLLDAETRYDLAPDEFKDVAADYLAAVRNDIPSEIPRFWWDFEFEAE